MSYMRVSIGTTSSCTSVDGPGFGAVGCALPCPSRDTGIWSKPFLRGILKISEIKPLLSSPQSLLSRTQPHSSVSVRRCSVDIYPNPGQTSQSVPHPGSVAGDKLVERNSPNVWGPSVLHLQVREKNTPGGSTRIRGVW